MMMTQDINDDFVLHVPAQEPSTFTKYGLRTGGSWPTSICARELKFGTQVKNQLLMVPDQVHGGQSHPWCHGSSSYMIHDLCLKFQLYSMILSVSRTQCPLCPYLEDVDGSWPGTWRKVMPFLVNPQKVILKISSLSICLAELWQYENFTFLISQIPSAFKISLFHIY